MIAGRHRFHGYGSLRNVYAHGQTARSGPLSLKYARRDADRPYRMAVVVSRKVHKSAVVRNRIRRRIYELVRTAELPIAGGSDLIFTAYDERLATMEPDQLKALVDSLLKKLPVS